MAPVLAGCGPSGRGAETDSEKGTDVEILNGALSQELAAIASYERLFPLLRGEALAVSREFQGQSQAHVDALMKSIRGLGGRTEVEPIEPESAAPRTREEALTLAYEEENRALALALEAAPRLNTSAPRTLAAALATSHAQHLAILRQLLGADLAAAAPEPYESGEEPPPAPEKQR